MVGALVLAMLRITDGHKGKVEAPVVKSWASHWTTEEARAMLDIVTDIYSYYIFPSFINFSYDYFFYHNYGCFYSMV